MTSILQHAADALAAEMTAIVDEVQADDLLVHLADPERDPTRFAQTRADLLALAEGVIVLRRRGEAHPTDA